MNILVIGLGSMGKRRLRLLQQNFPDYILYGVDSQNIRCISAEEEFAISTFSSIKSAIECTSFYAAVVSTAPLSHGQIIQECLQNNIHVFTELNLVSSMYTENISLSKKNNKILFLSSTFLYRSEIKCVKDMVSKSKVKLNYNYHVGQYLPDWHPWENFKDFFVGDKRSNGCREIFAVELPWLIRTFGKIKKVTVVKDNMSSLDLSYPDNFLVCIEHDSGHKGQFAVDIVTRIPVRHLEVFGEDLQIEWKGKPEELYIANFDFSEMSNINLNENIKRVDGYRDFIVENAYAEELKSFFEVCEGSAEAIYDFTDDLYTLSIIDEIEGLQ